MFEQEHEVHNIEEHGVSSLLLRLPQEIRDQIYAHTINYGVIFRLTESTSDSTQTDSHQQYALNIECQDLASSPLMEVQAFRDQVQKVYDLRIKTLRLSLNGFELTITPDLVDLVRTSRFELYACPRDSMAWLRSIPLVLGTNITSVWLSEINVRSKGRHTGLAVAWQVRYSGYSDLICTLKESCPYLTEIGSWIPRRYNEGYAAMAATQICNMLEEGEVERVCFVLLGKMPEKATEHSLLDGLLRKEQLDMGKIEASYQDGSHVEYVKSEMLRIAALGLRFDVEMEQQHGSSDGDLGDHTVITFRRVSEK